MTLQSPVLPDDRHNRRLVQNVHPPDWKNPDPAPLYNLVVIGSGPAGLVAAAGAASLGAKVALVEKHLIGGDCLNVGCVPSKALIRASRSASETQHAGDYGITASASVDFGTVMERVRSVRADISAHDAAPRFRDLGIDVFLGEASFIGRKAAIVDGAELRFKKAVIATGARAADPQIPDLEKTGYLTNETVFSLTELPSRLLVIGAGPIGCELAQAFARLGSKVTVVARSRMLSREDPKASSILAQVFDREGIEVLLDTKIVGVESAGGAKRVRVSVEGSERVLQTDEILVGAGRSPNVQGLDLEVAGVAYDDRQGVTVDDRMRTTNPRIFAAGDVCMKYKFTHAADAAARIVIQNALFAGRKKLNAVTIPWCTYTDPEIAHVGLYAHEMETSGIEFDTYETDLEEVDRALADGETGGFVRIHTAKGKDRILGATIVASHGGEMIGEICVAMAGNMGLGALSGVVHPYPTQAEAIRRAAEAYNRTRLTPFLSRAFNKWFEWTRK